MVPYYDACVNTLFRGALGYSARQALVEEYGYPFVDAAGYFDWRRIGGTGPAPREWCEHFAQQKVASPYGVRMRMK
jgi:hypothetical protein